MDRIRGTHQGKDKVYFLMEHDEYMTDLFTCLRQQKKLSCMLSIHPSIYPSIVSPSITIYFSPICDNPIYIEHLVVEAARFYATELLLALEYMHSKNHNISFQPEHILLRGDGQ